MTMGDTSEYEVVASDTTVIEIDARETTGNAAIGIADTVLDGRTLSSVVVRGGVEELGNESLVDMAVDLSIPAVGYETRLGEGGDKTTLTPAEADSPVYKQFEASPNLDLGGQAGNSVEIQADLLIKRHWGE